jgi:hypothetical protein
MAEQGKPIVAPRDKYLSRWQQLKIERESWMSHWQDISDYLLPRSGRFFVQDRDMGTRRHHNILDNTGTRALRILAAGMMSGMTSPARPWFRLATTDTDLMRSNAVKVWLDDVTLLIHTVFQRSNTYRALHAMYEELGAFGTAACIVLPDFNNVIHCYPLTVGEYAIATNWKGEVTTLYREFQKTVHELVTEFGKENCSASTQALYDKGNLDEWVTVVHAIEPRTDRDLSKSDAKNMPWASVYFELAAPEGKNLRESGYQRFPAVCPRWATSGGDIYGNAPGMEALGDIKQLQHEQLRKSQGIDYKTNPPLQVPTTMKGRDVDFLPGGKSYFDAATGAAGVRTAFEVNIDLSHLLADIADVRGRVSSSFYADLFLMISSQQDGRMTATEVAERHEEKMLMLGPVLERLQNELLDPLIEITFDAVTQAGIMPPPPPELQGSNVSVELVSMLAQAQRAVGTNSIDRFVGSLGAVAQIKPEVLDKFDGDAWVNEYSDSLGVTPKIILDENKVRAIRQQRAQAQAQAQKMAAMQQGADMAAKLGSVKTDPSDPNAAQDVTRAFSGYTQ